MDNQPVVRIAFLDVGQGDTIVISIPETKEAVIVDCIDANAVLNYLEREGIQHLRGLLITHLHLDHYSNVVQLLNNVEWEVNLPCEKVFFHIPKLTSLLRDKLLSDADGHSDDDLDNKSGARKRKDTLTNLVRWGQLNKERYNNLTKQAGIDNLPLRKVIELVHPWEIDIPNLLSRGLNNTSAVLKINGANSSALLTGDIEPAGWETVDKARLQSDILKFPHHGAWKDSDVDPLLAMVDPAVVVISVGTSGSRYQHPNQHVFEAIARLPHIRLLCTQVTSRCGKLNEQIEKKVKASFRDHIQEEDGFFIKQKGCPCAGTVIIELGESVRLIQPSPDFHKNDIIKSYYHANQCAL